MKKALLILAMINAGACLLLPLLLWWGHPLGMNRFMFEDYKEHYPGPIEITASSYTFCCFSYEIMNSHDFQAQYSAHCDPDITAVCYNSDTLYVITKCREDGQENISFFRAVNPVVGHKYQSTIERVKILDAEPDWNALIQRGYQFREFNWMLAIISYIGEPILIPLIPILSIIIIVLSIVLLFHQKSARRIPLPNQQSKEIIKEVAPSVQMKILSFFDKKYWSLILLYIPWILQLVLLWTIRYTRFFSIIALFAANFLLFSTKVKCKKICFVYLVIHTLFSAIFVVLELYYFPPDSFSFGLLGFTILWCYDVFFLFYSFQSFIKRS